jgi:hypothetical protein
VTHIVPKIWTRKGAIGKQKHRIGSKVMELVAESGMDLGSQFQSGRDWLYSSEKENREGIFLQEGVVIK